MKRQHHDTKLDIKVIVGCGYGYNQWIMWRMCMSACVRGERQRENERLSSCLSNLMDGAQVHQVTAINHLADCSKQTQTPWCATEAITSSRGKGMGAQASSASCWCTCMITTLSGNHKSKCMSVNLLCLSSYDKMKEINKTLLPVYDFRTMLQSMVLSSGGIRGLGGWAGRKWPHPVQHSCFQKYVDYGKKDIKCTKYIMKYMILTKISQ